MVFFSEGDAGLVEKAVVQAYVFAFGLRGYLHHCKGLKADVVRLCKGHHIGNQDGRAAAKPAYGDGALDNSVYSLFELESLLERKFRSAGIITPVALFNKGGT